jgi:hypothetical protein
MYMIVVNVGMRLKPPMALKALYVWLLGYYFYDAILAPHIPWTLFITYKALRAIGGFNLMPTFTTIMYITKIR